jgi:hypothetical protein
MGVGLGIAEPFTVTGSITGDQLDLTFSFDMAATLTASWSGTVTGSGVDNLDGSGTVGAPLHFGDYTVGGTASSTVLGGGFDYVLPGGGGGTFALTRPSAVESESWAEVKAMHRDR